MKAYLIISFLAIFYLPCQGISGGDYANAAQFPFAVAMAGVTPVSIGYRCTGSIINENWILLAANCFIQLYGDPTIFAGDLYWSDGTKYNITTWIGNPEYAHAAQVNDVAVAQVNDTFKFDQFVAPIKIGEPRADEAASVIGWGNSKNLKYANVTILSYEECHVLCPDPITLVPGSICSLSHGGVGPDFPDNGAPLVQNGVLVGIFSHNNGNVSIYGNAAYYLDWINDAMSGSL